MQSRYRTSKNYGKAERDMLESQELEQRILTELEEAGEENIPTLINTILMPAGDPEEAASMGQALAALVNEDLVRVAIDRDKSRRWRKLSKSESLAIIAQIQDHLKFKSSGMHWTGGERPWPNIVSTAAGKTRGREILDERGYQWWRQKK
jgi:hypothetical protein